MKFRELNDENIKNAVYTTFIANSKGFGDVDIKCNNKSTSKTSYSFDDKNKNPKDILDLIFGISKNKLNAGLTGALDSRILTLHSSALLALLFFYKVSDNNRITIEGVEYNDVLFEVKNIVVGGGPSRVDVLLSNNATNPTKLLFLESKFTEPLNRGKVSVSKEYVKYYKCVDFCEIKGRDNVGLKFNNLNLTIHIDKKDKNGEDAPTPDYCTGIKQMISHFIGLCKGPVDNANQKYSGYFQNAKELILGEILFEFPGNMSEMNEKIKDYEKLYEELAINLNKNKDKFKNIDDIKKANNIDKILVLDKALTYQGLLKDNPDYELDQKVKKFYQF